MRSSNAAIGTALDQLTSDVKDEVLAATVQGRAQPEPHKTALMKQALDTPHRARAQIAAWIAGYNARNGAGSAQTFLSLCLTASQSTKTLASIDTALANLEAQALVLVNHVNNDAWTWDQVATAIEAQITPEPNESFSYASLPIPTGYVTVWGEPW